MKRVLLLMVLAMIVFCANAQNPWKQISLTSSFAKGKDVFHKHFKPQAYVSFQLNESAMRKLLRNAPSEKSVSSATSSFIISVPNSKGQIERFRIVEASSMEPALAAKFPNIKSYAGQGVDNPGSRIRFDMSPLGFNAVIMSSERKTFYISSIDRSSQSYIVYDRELRDAKKFGFECLLDQTVNSEVQLSNAIGGGITDKNANTNVLRTYRLALCLTGEYSRAVLDDVAPGTDTSTVALKKAIILAVANSNTTEANAVFENEFNLRLVLISNETSIIYLDATTDPFSTWTPSFTTTTWNTETQNTCTSVIGDANYDIGHMLNYNTEKNNGNAGCIGCVCKTPSGSIGKGRGWNMYGEYQGDYLIIDYWTHELGHQLGGNHTFTHSIEGTIAQVEPGSASTIMGYAGITGATDLQAHSDPYYHAISIQQITDYIQTGSGNTCGTTSSLINNLPTANAGSDYTVPKSTPFILTGTSTDADAADVPTYCWEQMDAYGTSTNSNTYPTSTTTKGPAFRSFLPVTNTSRSFPRLQVVLDSNNTGKWEVLPSVSRTLNFRFTVRDNHSGGSANVSDDVVVTVSGTTGPFAVTSPNTAVSVGAGTTQTITWSVNSTNTLAANVKISMSTDGGQTFPYVLAASTPNDGTEAITVPNVTSGACRIKIEAIGNIFYDISNVNFYVGSCGTAIGLKASSITNSSATLGWTAVTGATSYDVDYRISPSGAWTNAATATTSTSVNITGLMQGTLYDFRVKTNCPLNNGDYATAQFTSLCSATPTGLTSSNITNSTATLSWTAVAGAASYKVDYKLSSASIWTRAANATTATTVDIANLVSSSVYNFRVRANCSSGSTAYISGTNFTTLCSAAPSGLSASSITNSGAILSWTASAGASSYTVDYKLASSGTWTNAATATTSTSVTLSGLSTGTVYDYRVRANCASGSTSYTSEQFTTLCNVAPSGLSASSVTNNSATISWSASTGAVSYDVDYKLTSTGIWTNAATATTSTSVNLNSLTAGSVYDYRVRANCAAGSTSYTGAQFTTLCDIAPTGLSASSITNTSATISWSASSGAVSYDFDYKLTSTGTWTNAATATTSTSVNLSGLTTGSGYDYRIRANCSSGSTTYTSAQFTTLCSTAPSGLAASSITTSSASISWSSATGATSYDVDYKDAASSSWINAATGTTAISVDLSSLNYSTVYDWRVKTNCASGSSAYSTSQFTTATPVCNDPSGLVSSAISSSTATISWSAVTGAASYDIDYKDAASINWVNAATGTTATSVNLSSLNANTTYDWRVRTNCIYGNTSNYTTAQFTTLIAVGCGVPVTLTTTNITASSATFNWTAVSGALGYTAGYRATNTQNWINVASGTTATSVNVSGLLSETNYEWRVKAVCASGSSAYNTTSFTTSATCPGKFDTTANNNNFATAVDIPFSTDVYGTINASGDVDYYKLTIPAPGPITVTLTNLPADYNIYTYNVNQKFTGSSINTGTANESITITVAKGTHYIKVAGANANEYNASTCYTLRAVQGTGPSSKDASSLIAQQSKSGMKVYPNPAHTIINIATTKMPEQSVIKIADVYGRTIMQQKGAANTKIDVSRLTAGSYFVTVITKEGSIIYNTKFVKY
ncbi:T9SS type A sorting domain-containing protein [Panacibacter ginsenosidivorans]|uniref:T9SS type A sorting domain-containing protein n=1 Tax=Panacibacter ginsenosidivorans TaxID=1813871 RepID=A0A5B8V475_9BACT|nr:fibronectin type III domain-containing protein [Panacibacter ginsenosidivorans]QEC66012.1 T9SS type A sorting domain-containing protein [Panacibacter ginsenosidivorans]